MIALARVIFAVIDFYSALVLVYCLMSWLPRGASGFIEDVRGVLASLCEPYLGFFRRFIPPVAMIDFSPIVAIIVLQLVRQLVATILL